MDADGLWALTFEIRDRDEDGLPVAELVEREKINAGPPPASEEFPVGRLFEVRFCPFCGGRLHQ